MPRAQTVDEASPPCCGEEAPRQMEFPYYSLRDDFNSSVLLVSASSKPLDFVLAVRSRSGQTVLAPAMTIQPQEKLPVDLGQLLVSQGADVTGDFSEGSVAVYFDGASVMLTGQLTTTNPARSLLMGSGVVDNSPGVLRPPPALNAPWWGLGSGGDAFVRVTNTSATTVMADVFLDFQGKRHASAPLSFAPYEAKVISITDLLGALDVSPAQAPEGGITIAQRGGKPSLIAQGRITDAATGFSSPLHFPDISFQKTGALRAGAIPIGTPAQDSPFVGSGTFIPHVIVRNLSGSSQNVAISLEYPAASGPQEAALAPFPVAGYETKDIPLDAALGLLPMPLPYASIRIQYGGAPGSVIAEVAGIESREDRVVPGFVVNEGDSRAGSGAYAWQVDDQTDSVLFLTNMGNAECPIGLRLRANGVTYHVAGLSLKAHETRTVSLRQLRDAQKPDFRGNLIPPEATDGTLHWARLENVPIMGHLDVIRGGEVVTLDIIGVCCCPAAFREIELEPSAVSLLPGQQVQFSSTLVLQDCYGVEHAYPDTNQVDWYAPNPAVAIVDNAVHKGLATAISGGRTSITAWLYHYPFYMCCNEVCQVCRYQDVGGGATLNVLTAAVDSISLPSDQVQVTVKGGSNTEQGTLLVTWNGPSGNANIASGTYAPGTYTFNPGLGSLVTGQYTGVTARWTLGNKTATGSRTSNFNVLGTWRHSQYNTPTESACSGSSSPAYEVNSVTCAYQTGNLISQFISQSWLNGSGKTINSYYGYKTEQNAQYCINHGSLPGDASGKSFAFVSQIQPYCSGGSLGSGTVAWNFSSTQTLNCNDQVLVVGLGGGAGTVKTVTDRCGGACSNTQLDNYTTSAACDPRSFTDLGNFKTIRINR